MNSFVAFLNVLNDLHEESDFLKTRLDQISTRPHLLCLKLHFVCHIVVADKQETNATTASAHKHDGSSDRAIGHECRQLAGLRWPTQHIHFLPFRSRNVQEIDELPFAHAADQRVVSKVGEVSEAVVQSIQRDVPISVAFTAGQIG